MSTLTQNHSENQFSNLTAQKTSKKRFLAPIFRNLPRKSSQNQAIHPLLEVKG